VVRASRNAPGTATTLRQVTTIFWVQCDQIGRNFTVWVKITETYSRLNTNFNRVFWKKHYTKKTFPMYVRHIISIFWSFTQNISCSFALGRGAYIPICR
jgi:hypothetical protein